MYTYGAMSFMYIIYVHVFELINVAHARAQVSDSVRAAVLTATSVSVVIEFALLFSLAVQRNVPLVRASGVPLTALICVGCIAGSCSLNFLALPSAPLARQCAAQRTFFNLVRTSLKPSTSVMVHFPTCVRM